LRRLLIGYALKVPYRVIGDERTTVVPFHIAAQFEYPVEQVAFVNSTSCGEARNDISGHVLTRQIPFKQPIVQIETDEARARTALIGGCPW
jgi:hypothetical protein